MTDRTVPAGLRPAADSHLDVLRQRAAELAAAHGITAAAEVAQCLGVSLETAEELVAKPKAER